MHSHLQRLTDHPESSVPKALFNQMSHDINVYFCLLKSRDDQSESLIRKMLFCICLLAVFSVVSGACPNGDLEALNGLCPSGTTINAAGTCCSSSGCADKINPSTGVSDCPKMAEKCKNSAYKEIMADQCPKTCGFCTGGCADKVNPSTGLSDCPKMTSYCKNSAYLETMKKECPKTCGFC